MDEDYWLASRCTYIFGDDLASFVIRQFGVYLFEPYGTDLCYIDGTNGGNFLKVRPIVTIPINKINLDGDYEANGNMWKLK